MTYYEDKKKALKEITDLYELGKSFDEILLIMQNKYGFGKKIIQDRINLIEKFGDGKNVD